jgi:hypothetical protein
MEYRGQKRCREHDGTYTVVKRLQRLTSYRKYLDNFLTRTGPFTDPDAFEPGDAAIAGLERMKIL